MILVIAATHQGFLNFCKQYGLVPEGPGRTAIYIHEIHQLYGYHSRIVLMAPDWWLGRGGSDFARSLDAAGIEHNQLHHWGFPNRLKFLEVL